MIFDDDVFDTSTIWLTAVVEGIDDDNWFVEQSLTSIVDRGGGSDVDNDWERTWIDGDCVSKY